MRDILAKKKRITTARTTTREILDVVDLDMLNSINDNSNWQSRHFASSSFSFIPFFTNSVLARLDDSKLLTLHVLSLYLIFNIYFSILPTISFS